MSEATDRVVEGLLRKRKLGSYYLNDIRFLDTTIKKLEASTQVDWHSHDGMVTVYDRDGRYMGCMGVERFHRLLAEDAISRGSNPAKRPTDA